MLIAGYDIAELDLLSSSIIVLNNELASAQRELLKANRKLQQNEIKLTKLTMTDPLTNIANRRYFDDTYNKEYLRAKRYANKGEGFCLALADIDNFKQVNDLYGHDSGDAVIQHFAQIMSESIRLTDFVARVGGEEFMLILPKTDLEGAQILLNRVRSRFKQSRYKGVEQVITASFGLTEFTPNISAEELLKNVDIALYKAKGSGRDKIVIN